MEFRYEFIALYNFTLNIYYKCEYCHYYVCTKVCMHTNTNITHNTHSRNILQTRKTNRRNLREN